VASARSEPIDIQALIASTPIERLNDTAEQYFASLTTWEHHLAKPFSGVDEAPWLLTHLAIVLQALEATPGATVLEFGAGTGWLSRFLTQLGCRAVLLDVSSTALRIAQELYRRVPVVGERPLPEFLLFDGRTIALPDASVDRIVSFHAFHHAPNPAAMVAEFARILRPGGRAVFAEPGPTHSRAPQSQFEMRTYGVVENDIDVHELWRAAQACGFSDMRLMIFHGLPFDVSLEQFEDFLRGGPTGAEWLAEARLFLRNVRNFVLVKEGAEREESRSARGIACEIHATLAAATSPAADSLRLAATVTNTGRAVWLPRSAMYGGVSLGIHVFDAAGTLVLTQVLDTPLTRLDREVLPGETATVDVALPPLERGRYVVEIDCVAANVGWFGQLGSRPARVDVTIG